MALKFGVDGWLLPGSDPNVKVDISHKTAKLAEWAGVLNGKPAGMVWHWTGGTSGNADGTSPALRNWLMEEVANPDRKASWHFTIGRDGSLYQHAPLGKATWHAGCNPKTNKCGTKFVYPKPPLPPFPTSSANSYFLGVEMENGGVALKQNGNWYVWPYAQALMNCSNTSMCSELASLNNPDTSKVKFDEKSRISPGRAVTMPNGTTYDAYTSAQVKTATELARALKEALGWWSPQQIHYGHYQFIDTKLDPGDFWMDNILPNIEKEVFGETAGPVGAGSAYGALAALAAIGAGYYFWKRSRR